MGHSVGSRGHTGRSVVKGPQLLAHDGIHRTLGVWERSADAKGGRPKAFRHSKAGVLGDDLLLSYPRLGLLDWYFPPQDES